MFLITDDILSVGLGIDCSKWIQKRLITESFKDDRDHTFYMCYIQDKYASSVSSAPFIDKDIDCGVSM